MVLSLSAHASLPSVEPAALCASGLPGSLSVTPSPCLASFVGHIGRVALAGFP